MSRTEALWCFGRFTLLLSAIIFWGVRSGYLGGVSHGQLWELMDFETDGEKLGRAGLAIIIHGGEHRTSCDANKSSLTPPPDSHPKLLTSARRRRICHRITLTEPPSLKVEISKKFWSHFSMLFPPHYDITSATPFHVFTAQKAFLFLLLVHVLFAFLLLSLQFWAGRSYFGGRGAYL